MLKGQINEFEDAMMIFSKQVDKMAELSYNIERGIQP
jgi:hypothetical protein